MPNMSHAQRKEREAQVKQMLTEGLSGRQIAIKLGISQQSLNNFLRLRGWRPNGSLGEGELEKRVVDMSAAGKPLSAISDAIGRTEQSIEDGSYAP